MMKPSAVTLANLMIAALLLLSPFLVGVTASTPYDPWSDLDADGDIDIFDVVKIAGAYGTTGDSGKNVTIAGRANKLIYTVSTSVAAHYDFRSGWIQVDGYSKVTVCLYSPSSDNWYQLSTRHPQSASGNNFMVDDRMDFPSHIVQTYDVPNAEIHIYFYNNDANPRILNIDVYAIP